MMLEYINMHRYIHILGKAACTLCVEWVMIAHRYYLGKERHSNSGNLS